MSTAKKSCEIGSSHVGSSTYDHHDLKTEIPDSVTIENQRLPKGIP